MQEPFSRRRMLGVAGTGLAGVASGCLTANEKTPEEPPPSSTPSETTGNGSLQSSTPSETTDDESSPESSTPSETTDTEPLPEPSDVSFESSSGATVEATLYGRGSCGIVLVPQVNLDRGSWRPQAERLAAEGLMALPIDEGSDRAAAVLAAIEYLRTEHSISDVILMGASTGGEAAVEAAATKPDSVDGLIALSAAGGVARANQLIGEGLFVVSSEDEQRFVDLARELYDRTAEPKRLEMYDGGAHGQRLFESPHRRDLWMNVLTLTTNVCQD